MCFFFSAVCFHSRPKLLCLQGYLQIPVFLVSSKLPCSMSTVFTCTHLCDSVLKQSLRQRVYIAKWVLVCCLLYFNNLFLTAMLKNACKLQFSWPHSTATSRERVNTIRQSKWRDDSQKSQPVDKFLVVNHVYRYTANPKAQVYFFFHGPLNLMHSHICTAFKVYLLHRVWAWRTSSIHVQWTFCLNIHLVPALLYVNHACRQNNWAAHGWCAKTSVDTPEDENYVTWSILWPKIAQQQFPLLETQRINLQEKGNIALLY